MEAAILVPQLANPTPAGPAKKAAAVASTPKSNAAAARRKTLCDITNLGNARQPAAEAHDDSTCEMSAVTADGGVDVAQLIKENSDLVRLLEERDKIIELSAAELQKLRLSNWQLAQANSQMLAELNMGRHRLKALQHEVACSRAALKVKTSDLEEAKKSMKHKRPFQEKTTNEAAQHLTSDKTVQLKDRGISTEPASDASCAASVKKACNASRKRMLRSRSLGTAASAKIVTPKEKDTQRRKSLRTPESSNDHTEDFFEIEDVQLAINTISGTDKKEMSGQEMVQFPHRSSLGRPLRRAKERVTSYKEMPVNIKLRRP